MGSISHQIKVEKYFYLVPLINMDQINFLDIQFGSRVNLIHNLIKFLFNYLMVQIK